MCSGFEVQAFKKLPNGKYDLNRWNDEYWNRFEALVKLTSEREIIIQIEVWDRFDYTDHGRFESWNHSPYNPANNINYTPEESGLATSYPKHHPGADKQPFFHTIPKMDDNKVLRRYQEAFVDKMLSYSLPCGNVLYCMNNEMERPPQPTVRLVSGILRDRSSGPGRAAAQQQARSIRRQTAPGGIGEILPRQRGEADPGTQKG